MFRTFTQNPSLGGFGGESSRPTTAEEVTPDAFCQIIKELVDNAVDACTVDSVAFSQPKRVRVVIEEHEKGGETVVENNRPRGEILRVTVTDNGCGMHDIAACVGAFHSSKSGPQQQQSNSEKKNDAQQTAGRYGIGLTLCLLHAQRLVPDSCASIQSARREDHHWTTMVAVVDTETDAVRCVPQKDRRKRLSTESGTAVSVLVPGGKSAKQAWPRLAEYFARFQFSLKMRCSLEVRATTISLVPLFVQPTMQRNGQQIKNKRPGSIDGKPSAKWRDMFSENTENGVELSQPKAGEDDCRQALRTAAASFLGKRISIDNVAYFKAPIRMDIQGQASTKSQKRKIKHQGPSLDVAVIVHSRENEAENSDTLGNDGTENRQEDEEDAELVLIRMVNKIPMLDSSEAIACGLVQGLVAKKQLWRSFGLDVTLKPSNTTDASSCAPSYTVRDTEQVASFVKKGTHDLFENQADPLHEAKEPSIFGPNILVGHPKRLPAHIRLGNILVVVGIHADPSTMPLPTLSKGRLPVDNKPVKDALGVGVNKCLEQIQKSNPSLLLSAVQLRRAERDAAHVPAAAVSLASILCKASTQNRGILERIASWGNSERAVGVLSRQLQPNFSQEEPGLADIAQSIEDRLRRVLTEPKAILSEPDQCDDGVVEGAEHPAVEQFPWTNVPASQRMRNESNADSWQRFGDSCNQQGRVDDTSSYRDL